MRFARSAIGLAARTHPCAEFARLPDPATELTIDAGIVLLAITLGRITPAIADWLRRNPDKVQPILTIAQNRAAGSQFEQIGLKWLGMVKNGQPIAAINRNGQLQNVIPENVLNGFYEFKNVRALGDARGQLSAMGELTARFGVRFDIFLGPRFEGQISATVRSAVDIAGGAVWRLDPQTGFLILEYGTP